jgi:hypothetical protein
MVRRRDTGHEYFKSGFTWPVTAHPILHYSMESQNHVMKINARTFSAGG